MDDPASMLAAYRQMNGDCAEPELYLYYSVGMAHTFYLFDLAACFSTLLPPLPLLPPPLLYT